MSIYSMMELQYSIKSKRNFIGKFGLISKGALYFVTGLLVCMTAFEIGEKSVSETGKSGVFNVILEQPAGKILLVILAAGILSYSTWRFLQAFADTEQKGDDIKGIARRSMPSAALRMSEFLFLPFGLLLIDRINNRVKQRRR